MEPLVKKSTAPVLVVDMPEVFNVCTVWTMWPGIVMRPPASVIDALLPKNIAIYAANSSKRM
jgi:hypothetical protein